MRSNDQVPAIVIDPDGLLMSMAGMVPAAVVWKPVIVWFPVPLTSRFPVPPPANPTWASMFPWAARVPVFRVPLKMFRVAAAFSVVPAAMVIVPPRMSMLVRVWVPVIVPPAKA